MSQGQTKRTEVADDGTARLSRSIASLSLVIGGVGALLVGLGCAAAGVLVAAVDAPLLAWATLGLSAELEDATDDDEDGCPPTLFDLLDVGGVASDDDAGLVKKPSSETCFVLCVSCDGPILGFLSELIMDEAK